MDLLQAQIKESCSLALPEGLKDLMSDISREVLRARPNNIPQFIADYLEVLLEVREKLSIACHLYNDIRKDISKSELYDEFKAIGLSEENINMAIKIVEKHFDQNNVKEQSLLMKLSRKMSIDELQLPSIRDAVQTAFKRHLIKDGVLSGREYKNKEVAGALHTLDLYKQHDTTTEEVFLASKFDPCVSTISSPSVGSHLTLPKYKTSSAHDRSVKEKEDASYDYSSTSIGKVKFIEEKFVFKTDNLNQEGTRISEESNVWDDHNIDCEDNDCDRAGDINGIIDEAELTDNDIEENINSASSDDTSSTIREDFDTGL